MDAKQDQKLFAILKTRFEAFPHRHVGLKWTDVLARLMANPQARPTLHAMENSGGEPDVVTSKAERGQWFFIDCSAESPSGRRSLCYDRAALASRKDNAPANCAIDVATAMGIELLNEQQYRDLQQLERFDMKTSSWIKTPESIRALGGALFCDRRYDQVFTYHNGAQSYYAARGFRGVLAV